MPSTGMGNSLRLDTISIINNVPETLGAYVLGFQKPDTFTVSYVGRSDVDLRDRLLKHIGERYTDFKFITLSSTKEAFEKECTLYHDFGENKLLHNKEHPARPANTSYLCPRCNIFNSLGRYYI